MAMRPTKAHIDLDALRHNLSVAARHAPGSKNLAVIKRQAMAVKRRAG